MDQEGFKKYLNKRARKLTNTDYLYYHSFKENNTNLLDNSQCIKFHNMEKRIKKSKGGMLVGNSHEKGGIEIKTPEGKIEAEGGEIIINKKSSEKYCDTLSKINEAEGGVKIPCSNSNFYRNGGKLESMNEGKKNSVLDKKWNFEDGVDTYRNRIKRGVYSDKEFDGKEYSLIEIINGKKVYQPVNKTVYDFFEKSKHTEEKNEPYLPSITKEDVDIFYKIAKYAKEDFSEYGNPNSWTNDEIWDLIGEEASHYWGSHHIPSKRYFPKEREEWISNLKKEVGKEFNDRIKNNKAAKGMKIISKRKNHGKIVELEPRFSPDASKYILYDKDGNFLEDSLDYNYLHKKLYADKAEKEMKIKNQYSLKLPKEVWESWDIPQKVHFINDHKEELLNNAKLHKENLKTTSDFVFYKNKNFSELPSSLKESITNHVYEGQYKKGGSIKKSYFKTISLYGKHSSGVESLIHMMEQGWKIVNNTKNTIQLKSPNEKACCGRLLKDGGEITSRKVENIKNQMYKTFESFLSGKINNYRLVSRLKNLLGDRKWFRFFHGDTLASDYMSVENDLKSPKNTEYLKENMQISLDTKQLEIYDFKGNEIFKKGGNISQPEFVVEIISKNGKSHEWIGKAKNEDDALYKAEKDAGFESKQSSVVMITDENGNNIKYKKGGKTPSKKKWIQGALSGEKGKLRDVAKRQGLISGEEKLSMTDIKKLEKSKNPKISKRAHLAETLMSFNKKKK